MAASVGPGEGASSLDDGSDPFVSRPTIAPPASTRPRYSHFDTQLFALGPGASPEQAQRVLEAHLADTERRLEETGKLGNALVQQRMELVEKLKEVEKLKAEGELTAELRQRLVEIEKEFHDVARESARAFLPKQRIPSNEAAAAAGSPFVPDAKAGGRRSVSPSKLEAMSTGSPTKFSVPNRKLRNQRADRMQDIEFAAEISQSLIAQVRSLQQLLAEREEELRDTKAERSKLEMETETLHQKLKALDESEHRYKDENWNLETQIHELLAAQKEAADREKRLTQNVNVLVAEKTAAQRELDDVKLQHSKLVEEHAAIVKQHDIELGIAKRNIAMAETERAAMQRKVDDLAARNEELAKAFSMQRGRALEREQVSGLSDEDFETANDNITPEHSPPPSPVKGTPRHSMLESETLKTSLLHANRTILSLRTNVHKEKTEKMELRRMLQEARDELEKVRNEGATGPTRRNRKVESREFRRTLRGSQLGASRSTRSEIFTDDPEWEDHVQSSPTQAQAGPSGSRDAEQHSSSEYFETAHETSDAAFETAHERGTETEDFHTGVEEFSDDDDTETESPSRGAGRAKMPSLAQAGNRQSFLSTASTSNDEDWEALNELRTPTAAVPPQKMRLRVSRGALSKRTARAVSEEPPFQSSPASYMTGSASGTPQQAGQSLYAELGDLDDQSDDESIGMTPSRGLRSVTPGSAMAHSSPQVPRLPMVDSGVMTEPFEEPATPAVAESRPKMVEAGVNTEPIVSERPLSMDSVIYAPGSHATPQWLGPPTESGDGASTRPVSMFSYSDASAQHEGDLDERLAQFPSPPGAARRSMFEGIPEEKPEEVPLVVSTIMSEDVEPVSEPETVVTPPALAFSSVVSEGVEPQAEPVPPPAPLEFSSLWSEHVEPRSEPEMPPAPLTFSATVSEDVIPQAEPERLPPPMAFSGVTSEDVEPVAPQSPVLPVFTASSVQTVEIEPEQAVVEAPAPVPVSTSAVQTDAEPQPEPPVLSTSAVQTDAEPVPEPPVLSTSAVQTDAEPQPEPPVLSSSAVQTDAEPVPEPPVLSTSAVQTDAEPVPEPPVLSTSAVQTDAEPVPEPPLLSTSTVQTDAEPVPEPPVLSTSAVQTDAEPVPEPPVLSTSAVQTDAEPVPEPPLLSTSAVQMEDIEPVKPAEVELPVFSASGIQTEEIEPVMPTVSSSWMQTDEIEVVKPVLGTSAVQTDEIPPVMPVLTASAVHCEEVEPVVPEVAPLALSAFETVETEPIEPRSPKRDAFIIPRDKELSMSLDDEHLRTPTKPNFNTMFGRKKGRDAGVMFIAEDETRQSPSNTAGPETPESQRPLKEMSANSDARPPRKQTAAPVDQASQTALTSDAIDQLMRPRYKAPDPLVVDAGHTPSVVRVRRPSQSSISSVSGIKAKGVAEWASDAVPDAAPAHRRPGSSSSTRAAMQNLPPLPPNHREVIEAARTGSAGGGTGTIGSMGPPPLPASAFRNPAFRPRTPTGGRPISPASGRGTPTPKPIKLGSTYGTASEVHSPTRLTHRSRQSSVTSFASEIDTRFNLHGDMGGQNFGTTTDPRMIQAITQTMIGEYLWKYTRKTGRGDMSENRHRRYFWVHPYTRTLYWSDRDPASGGRAAELRAKSVQIEAVRVVTDDNPMPPGLHRKSLIVIAPGRSVKFTCTTGQRHETWFNALSYLLLRTNGNEDSGAADAGAAEDEAATGGITRDDVDEFNPTWGRRGRSNGAKSHPPVSLNSYGSRVAAASTTRADSPAVGNSMNFSMQFPTLTPTPHRNAANSSTASTPVGRQTLTTRISGYWKGGVSSTFSSLRSRSRSRVGRASLYDNSEAHDSAEEVRLMIEQQDREAARLENVRACCDGKHDVSTLVRSPKKGRQAHHQHTHSQDHQDGTGAATAETPTPMSSMRTRS